jgi:two-component system response regulator AtoC
MSKIERDDRTSRRGPFVLAVDDDPDTRDLLHEVLNDAGYTVFCCSTAEEAVGLAKRLDFDVIISDIRLGPQMSGLDVLRAYKAVQPRSEVILITAFGSMETAIEAVKAGAFDYLSKPFKIEEVLLLVRRALDNRRLMDQNEPFKTRPSDVPAVSGLVGRSPAMLEVYKKIGMVASGRSTVLIYGESGTGKELVAKAIHSNGPRAHARFLAVNCGGFTESLLESELFGHVRGAFTGATVDKAGILEDASEGTVFLDEVSEMSPALQVKLLRTLEDHEVRPVGSNHSIKIDVRVIAASNRRLGDLVGQGRFREDLYYRLRVIEINLPPLRDRSEDIPLLISHFLHRFAAELDRSLSITDEARDALITYAWPGNVRELENTLESIVALSRSGVISLQDLPPKMQALPPRPEEAMVEKVFEGLPTLEELGKRYVRHVLKATGGNKTDAAAVLGVARKTIYRMLGRWPMPPEEMEADPDAPFVNSSGENPEPQPENNQNPPGEDKQAK